MEGGETPPKKERENIGRIKRDIYARKEKVVGNLKPRECVEGRGKIKETRKRH